MASLTSIPDTVVTKLPFLRNKYIRNALMVLSIALLAIITSFLYAYFSTPANIRSPHFEHLHFRMQMIVDGKQLNFADKKYQQGYSADNCNAELTLSPFHFHDSKDQFVHVHWRDMTGGQLLKFYGLNKIGGVDGSLGFRFDQFPNLRAVPTHGKSLPQPTEGDKYYVYVGDESGYQARAFTDFVNQDFETFFGKQSSVPAEDQLGLMDRLFPKASAHNGVDHSTGEGHDSEDLKRLNNLLGNIVIFAQKHQPTAEQIKAHFAELEPLSGSACAG